MRKSRLRLEFEQIVRVLDRDGVLIATMNPVTRVRRPLGRKESLPNPMPSYPSCSELLDVDDTWQMMIAERHDAETAKQEVMQATK